VEFSVLDGHLEQVLLPKFYALCDNLGVHRHFGKKKRKKTMKRERKRILTVALFLMMEVVP
jgi:hypothetical protein